MEHLNTQGPQPRSGVAPFYENAKSKEPSFYSTYTFEQWLTFMKDSGLIVLTGDTVSISVFGTKFLEFLPAAKAPPKAH